MLTLVMNPGLPEQQSFVLTPGARVTIGRTKDNAVLCLHKSLSRAHAELSFDGDRVRLTDLQSKNGVFVNGRRVARAEIGEGETFRCGDVSFFLEGDGPAHAKADGRGKTQPTPRSPSLPPNDRLNNTLPSPFAVDTYKSKPPPPSPGPGAEDERVKEKLFLLMRASELCVTDLPIDRLLQDLVGLAAQVFEADRLCVLMLDDRTLELRLRVNKSFVPVQKQAYSIRVVDWVVDHGSPVSYDDISTDRTLPGDLGPDEALRAAMCVPINPGAGMIGVFYADSLTLKGCFKADDVALLRALANLAAIAIESASLRLHERPTLAKR